jgi:hypothetical protein
MIYRWQTQSAAFSLLGNTLSGLAFVVLCVGCASTHSGEVSPPGGASTGGSDVIKVGSIGGIKIGTTEERVLAIAKRGRFGKLTKGEDVVWEAIDYAIQEWKFSDAGLSLDMGSEKIGGKKTVFSVTITGSSKLRTGRGIGIGDSRADVVKAYAGFKSEPEEQFLETDNVYLVGSIFGGMVFSFENEKVTKIFLGASAE